MTQRLWIIGTVILGLGGVWARAESRPNVVLIISDDQGWTDFGFMGHAVVKTPNLDRLASQGALFPHAYVTVPLCRASLASIITGLYPQQHRICGNDPPNRADRTASYAFIREVATIPRLLRDAGYRSLQTGKFWEGRYSNGGFTDGMTAEDGRHGGAGLTIGRDSMQPIYDFIEQCRDQPFFIWYAPTMPHEPHNPPARILKKYAVAGRHAELAKYWAMCEWFDETCGDLMAYLKKKNLDDHTLIVFIVDNGWIQETGSAPSPAATGASGPAGSPSTSRPGVAAPRRVVGSAAAKSKLSPYDGGVRTPVIVRWPGHIKPGRFNDLVSSIDVAPTILRACGVEPPKAMGGLNLVDIATGQAHPGRQAVFGAVFGHADVVVGEPARNVTHRWVRAGDWKLIAPVGAGRPVELYQISEDPTEEKNLATSRPEVVGRLREQLDAWWMVAAPAGE